MRHGHVVAVDRVGVGAWACAGIEMRDDLMAVEIEIDPFGRAAALAAAKHAAVKGARGGEIVDRKGEMERADRIGQRVPALSHPPPLGESIAEPDRRAARSAATLTPPKPGRDTASSVEGTSVAGRVDLGG